MRPVDVRLRRERVEAGQFAQPSGERRNLPQFVLRRLLTVLSLSLGGTLACSSGSSGGADGTGGGAGLDSGGAAGSAGIGGTNPGGNSSGGAAVGGFAGAGGSAGASGAAGAGGFAAGGSAGAGGIAGGASAGGTGGAAGASGAGSGGAACSPFAVRAVAHEFGPGQTFGQQNFPDAVLGAPRGGGCCGGSLDVISLGIGGWVVLELGQTAVDGPGVDLLVFENPFEYGAGQVFAEPATVAVSADGETWFSFPCAAAQAPWGQCAGTHPVYANIDENDIDPTDPGVAGGDGYDLADVGLSEARYVRITDRADLTSSVFDLDAVAVVNGQCGGAQ